MSIPKFRLLLKLSAGLVLSFCLWLPVRPLASVWGAQPSAKPSMAYGVISNAVAPLWVAQDQGLFRKYGVDPDLVFIIAGTATQAMIAGQVPFGLLAITHVANAVAAGGDLTMVLSFFNTLDYLFVS